MSDLNNMLEGTKILSLTDANGRAHEFISETEQEKAGFKLKYYMWLSRLFILFAIVSLLVFGNFQTGAAGDGRTVSDYQSGYF